MYLYRYIVEFVKQWNSNKLQNSISFNPSYKVSITTIYIVYNSENARNIKHNLARALEKNPSPQS